MLCDLPTPFGYVYNIRVHDVIRVLVTETAQSVWFIVPVLIVSGTFYSSIIISLSIRP